MNGPRGRVRVEPEVVGLWRVDGNECCNLARIAVLIELAEQADVRGFVEVPVVQLHIARALS